MNGSLSLLLSIFSGVKDAYGQDEVPPLPLTFDRVNEGRPPQPNTSLLRLPVELLALVIQHVDQASLSSLALASRDCLQLSRSRRFASVHLDYSSASHELICALILEWGERASNGGITSLPSIGVCIRRITVAANPRFVSERFGITHHDDFMDLDESIIQKKIAKADRFLFNTYVSQMRTLFWYPSALPHLELLDWEDKILLPRSFFNGLARSRMKHLKLFRVCVNEEYEIELPNASLTKEWSLRTLHLELNPSVGLSGKVSTLPLCASILRACASTLESLVWELPLAEKDYSSTLDGSPPNFACLRKLQLGQAMFSDSLMLEALMHDGLCALDTDLASNRRCKIFFKRRGKIPSLRTLVWSTSIIHDDEPLDFHAANSHITALSLPYPTSMAFLEKRLLPLLSASFSRLTSLCLAWEEAATTISNSALAVISTLTTLEQIHLQAGQAFGWRHDWAVDHKSMRSHLKKLPCLKRMALSRDSYPSSVPYTSIEGYYTDRYPSDFLRSRHRDPEEDARRFEKDHRHRILSIANHYVRMMPKLEWLYFGQIPMQVDVVEGRRTPVALSQERDDCFTYLSEIFGWKK